MSHKATTTRERAVDEASTYPQAQQEGSSTSTTTKKKSEEQIDLSTTTHLSLLQTSIQANILSVVLGVAGGMLLYGNYLMFEEYIEVAAWGFLLAQALHGTKQRILESVEGIKKDKRSFVRLLVTSGAHFHPIQFILNFSFPFFAALLFCTMLTNVMGLVPLLFLVVLVFAALSVLVVLLGKKVLSIWRLIGLSDEYAISLGVIFGLFFMTSFVVLFLGAQTLMEGVDAAVSTADWIQGYVQEHANNQNLVAAWKATTETAGAAMDSVESSYNNSRWWPLLETVRNAAEQNTTNSTELSADMYVQVKDIYGEERWFSTFDEVFNFTLKEDGNITQMTDQAVLHAKQLIYEADFWELTESLSGLSDYAWTVISNPVGLAMTVISYVQTAFAVVSSFGAQAIFFLFFTLNMLTHEVDMLHVGIRVIFPAKPSAQDKLATALRNILEGVFTVPFQLASLHATITLLTFSLLRVPFTYFGTFLVFIITLVPLFDAFYVSIPWSLALVLPTLLGEEADYFSVAQGIAVFLIHFISYSFVDDHIYEQAHEKGLVMSPVLTAMGVGLGYGVFGGKGVILGPILVGVLAVVIRMRTKKLDDKEARTTKTTTTTTTTTHAPVVTKVKTATGGKRK